MRSSKFTLPIIFLIILVPGILKAQDSTVRLGTSRYYITLPAEFKISEARGKEGQLGYDIMPKDTGNHTMGFIEIRKGNSINDESIESGKQKEYIAGTFLGKEIRWAVERTETGYLWADTPDGDITAWISSKDRKEIEKLIRVFATVVKK